MTKPNPLTKSRKELAREAHAAGYDIRAPRLFCSSMNSDAENEEVLALNKDANDAFESWWLLYGRHYDDHK